MEIILCLLSFVSYANQPQDRSPLQAIPPQITPADANVVAEVPSSKDDVYRAQLQMSKAGKVQAAEALLGKAANDPKVKKLINKKTTGRGRGKGRGKGAVKSGEDKQNNSEGAVEEKEVPEDANIVEAKNAVEVPGGANMDKENKDTPKENDKANEVLEDQWKEIDTWYVCSAVFFPFQLCVKQKNIIYCRIH